MADTRSFHCRQCGTCCRWPGFVYLTDHDITRLALALDLTEHEFIQAHTRLSPDRRRLCLQTDVTGPCVFLEDGRCCHYEARPQQCRDYPHRWSVAEGCPGFDGS